MRYDIAFFLCCCRSFLSSSGRRDANDAESYYDLLGVPPTAHPDDIKRAYKRQSLLMHPDKLAQRGKRDVTEIDRDRFTRMKHAYEVLSDGRRRETYDAVGERGMRWVEEPLSVDPRELAHNFATSGIYDRSKIFAIFLLAYVAVFILPVLICLMADGTLGGSEDDDDTAVVYWCAIFVPLWIWDVFILFYHSRVILMGPITRPEHVPEDEWVDPLPMSRRISALIRFVFLVTFQILLALRLDGFIGFMPWMVVFTPLYIWDGVALRRKIMLACLVIVTPDELELAIGKRLCLCTPHEREAVGKRYVVIPPGSSPARNAANRLISEARMDVVRILARMTFFIIVALNLDLGAQWNWWLIFLPIFGMSACIIGSAVRNFAIVKDEAVRSDPVTFASTANGGTGGEAADPSNSYSNMNNGGGGVEEENPISDEEREELRAKVAQSAYRAGGTCLSQCFIIIMVCVLVGKIQGAGYSLLLVISPFLVAGGMVLCCLACTIFCISEVDENAGMAEFESAINLAAGGDSGAKVSSAGGLADESYDPPKVKTQGGEQLGGKENSHHATTGGSTVVGTISPRPKPPPSSTWDPELGEVWQNATEEEEAEKEHQRKTIDTKLDEAVEEVAPTAVYVTSQRIEENPSTQSMSSSQCDLD